MKSSTPYFGILTVSMLLVMGTVLFMSLGFQIFWDEFGSTAVAGYVVVFILAAVGFMIPIRKQGCAVLKKWWHKRLIVDGTNRMPRIFYLLLSRSSCKSCPFVTFCLKH
jgi:amino acid transporter